MLGYSQDSLDFLRFRYEGETHFRLFVDTQRRKMERSAAVTKTLENL